MTRQDYKSMPVIDQPERIFDSPIGSLFIIGAAACLVLMMWFA